MTVRRIMTPISYSVSPNDTILEATRQMRVHNTGMLPVTEGDAFLGLITGRDVAISCVAAGQDPSLCKVKECMQSNVVAVTPTEALHDALRIMGREHVCQLCVLEDGHIIGIVELGQLALQAIEVSALSQGPY